MSTKTPNQIVAANLKRARNLQGWTQAETADRLGIGRANYSLIEGSYARGTRIRNHSADDLTTYSELFGLPVLWFLLPPIEGEVDDPPTTIATDDGEMPVDRYVEAVWPHIELARIGDPDPQVGAFEKRLVDFAGESELAQRIREAVAPDVADAVAEAIPVVADLIRTLRARRNTALMEADQITDTLDTLTSKLVAPVWSKAVDEAAVSLDLDHRNPKEETEQ